MKKKFYILALVLLLPVSVFANDIKESVPKKQQSAIEEIALDTTQNSSASLKDNLIVDSSLVDRDASSTETSLKKGDSVETSAARNMKIFSYLNPIKPIKKIEQGVEFGLEYINNYVDRGIDKVDVTPFKGIQKIDNTVDKSFLLLDGAVKTGVDVLDEAVGDSLGTLDKVITGSVQKDAVNQWLNADNAARKCFGARPLLESHGITLDSSFLYSPFFKTGGGANGGQSARGYSLYNLGITLDTEAAKLWKGGKFFALYQKKTGYGISGPDATMGDYMGFDGWDWTQINKVSEYWYQQELFDGKIRMKFGKQDSNTDFGYLNSGWDFMNSGFSVNPTTPLPTYPDSNFGFMAEINPKEWLSIRDGVYDKHSKPYNITEVEVKSKIKELPGRYIAGAWELGNSKGMGVATGVDGEETTYNNFYRNFGTYFGFEQMLYKEKKKDDNDMQGLVVFGQLGLSPSSKNDMHRYVGTGLHYKGLVPNRDNDLTGIAIGSGRFASRLNSIETDYGGRVGSETVIETFYRLYMNKWFYLQPDAQLIMNPSGIYKNSVAIGIRSVITF